MNAPILVENYRNGARHRALSPRLLLVREEQGSAYGSSGAGSRATPEATSDWSEVHERIVRLGAERAAHERELGRWLRAAERLAVHARTGHASLREYAERILGLTGRQLEERLRVARALGELSQLDQALASGELSWSAVRELTRIATPETERAWLEWAKGRSSRQIEQAVAARRPGDRPRDRPDPSLVKHRLRFEVRAETMALFRELQSRVRADLGEAADDDALLFEIARRALGGPGPSDGGRASYQVAVTRCPECGRASVDAAGQSFDVDQIVAEMAACDCQQLGHLDGHGVTGESVGAPHKCSSERDEDEDSSVGFEQGAPGYPSGENSAAAGPHVGAIPREQLPASIPDPHARQPEPVRPARRATQSVPPATRRAVLRRDHNRCVVEGCRNHRFLDVHHVTPRAEGGTHDPDQIASLCGQHHRAVHQGSLVMDGSATGGFTFRHADGTPYGRALRPSTVELAEQTFGALRTLGFGHTRARALVDSVLRAGAPAEPAEFLRAALQAS